MRKSQNGASIFVVVFLIVICVFFVLLGAKSLPVVTEYFGIKKMISQLVQEGGNLSVSEIKDLFTKKATIQYTGAVVADDLDVQKDGNNVSINVSYDKPVRLFGDDSGNHFDLVFHFVINEGKKQSKDKSIE